MRSLDAVSRFLYSARSVILVISAQAAVIAGLLAANAGRFSWPEFIGVLAGFVVAHMISNLSNDYFGFRRGHDTPNSPRMRYTVHPLAGGVLETRTLVTGLAILGAVVEKIAPLEQFSTRASESSAGVRAISPLSAGRNNDYPARPGDGVGRSSREFGRGGTRCNTTQKY